MSDRYDDLFNEKNDEFKESESSKENFDVENYDSVSADGPDTQEFLRKTDVSNNIENAVSENKADVYNTHQQDSANATVRENTVNNTQQTPYTRFDSNSVSVEYKQPASTYQSVEGYSQPQYSQQGFNPQYTQQNYQQPQYQQPQHMYQNPYAHPQTQHIKKKKDKKTFSAGFVAVMLVVCILFSSVLGFLGSVLYTQIKVKNAEISDNGAMIINKVDIDEQTAQTLADKPTSQITDEVADTVVEITTETMSTNSFYGQYVSQGAGSGVIISADGYILTNNHVIDGATSITVTLRDKTSYQAKLVGKDSIIDVALLKIDATGLKAANFGDSDKLKVGDKAVAIGNPLGQLGGTVTDGIISALDRDVVIDDETMSLLQTDSAINPGNSGGGLFDGQGALIGIVVAKSSGEEIEGLGFAIPINDVIEILDDLKEYGYVRGRVSAGMQLIDLSNSMYSMYYYGNTEDGCYVYSVEFDSAAYKAGIQQGDRIVSVNGKGVSTSADVEKALENAKVGDKVTFEIERNGRTADVSLELAEYVPQDAKAQQNQDDVFNPFA